MNLQEIIKVLELLAIQSKEDRIKAAEEYAKFEKDRDLWKENMKKLEQDLGMRWDHAEEVIYRGIKKNLASKWIEIYNVYRNRKTKNAEFDIIAVNGKQVIVVEVKNKLKQDHIDYFESHSLKAFKKEFPEYKDYELLWWVAWLIVSDHIEKVAEKRGLFVFRQNGDHVEIINSPDFKPKVF